MIARIWRTRIDELRTNEYLEFARTRSVPVFRAHDGFLGVVFAKHRDERTVITLWRDLTSAQALDDSQIYKTTVAEIDATGFITGPSMLEVVEVEELVLDEIACDPEATDSG